MALESRPKKLARDKHYSLFNTAEIVERDRRRRNRDPGRPGVLVIKLFTAVRLRYTGAPEICSSTRACSG